MTAPIGGAAPLAGAGPLGAPGASGASEAERLRDTARQLEGVFVEQLFKAMRETVPEGGGVVDGGSGEAMFTGMLDQELSGEVPARWEHGLSEALYRQLRGRAGVDDALPAALPVSPDSPAVAPDRSSPSPVAPILGS